MSGQIIGQVAGTIIGTMVGGPIGGFIGGGIGGAVGSSFDSLPTQYGPRLDDLRVQRSEYGYPIPIVYGTAALQGTVIWAQDIKEVQTETEQGGKGGPSQTTVTYSYFGNFAVAICEGPIGGVLRIWAGPEKRLIYDGVALEGGSVRIYLGDETQMPDPLIETDKGVGLAPAYRGTAYVVFEDFPLLKDGNRLPFLTFEVTSVAVGNACGTDYIVVGDYPNQARLYDRPPVKLGSFDGMVRSTGRHPTAVDNDGNIYVLVHGNTLPLEWYLKKVSAYSPVTEDLLYLGDEFASGAQCSMAFDPIANHIGVIQESTTNLATIDCASFEKQYEQTDFAKSDIVFSEQQGRLRMLNSSTHADDSNTPSEDNYGYNGIRAGGQLIDCGVHGMAVAWSQGTYICDPLGMVTILNAIYEMYDPVRDRLLSISGSYRGYGYYEFSTGMHITPTDVPDVGANYIYAPEIDRILYGGDGISVMEPSTFTPLSMPTECTAFTKQLVYGDGVTYVGMAGGSYIPVAVPGLRNMLAVVPRGSSTGSADIFLFPVGGNGKGVTLASIVANLSERSGEARYDVSQLESDIVDGYVIARQTQVRAAIDALRPAYYFDAVESQGIIKYVKRGGSAVAVVDDDDLAARDAGSEAGDPLRTVRRMEVELPRAVNVKYMLAADDYNQAAKQVRRLIGSSGDEQTVDIPLVMTDTKAQEVAEVNLHAAWAERLTYEFSLPRKYSYLEPTDLIMVKDHLMRLTKVTATPRGVLQCEAVSDESTYYAPHVVVTETQPKDQTVAKPGVTLMELF